jgi:Zn-dependent M16 (insulinase) family peptidase
MKAIVNGIQEKMKANEDTTSAIRMEATINSIQSEFEGTIRNRVQDVLASVHQQTQALRKELNGKMELLCLVMMSLDTLTKGLCNDIANVKKELHEEFKLKTVDTQMNIQTTKTFIEIKVAEVEA